MASSTSVSLQEYDAVVIGAGHNGLTCACYLARAGLKTLVLEQYHSIGGMTITEEITLPGFKSDIHAFGYQLANLSPVPFELGLDKNAFELIQPEISYSHIYPEGGFISMHRGLDQTVKSIEKYSRKDGITWKKMFEEYYSTKDSIISAINNPPPPISSILEGVDKNPDLFDKYRAGLQSMRSWTNEWFESEEVKVMFGSFAAFIGLSPDDAGGGEVSHLFSTVMQDGGNNVVKGGFGNLPLALAKYLESKGGQIMTNSSVEKIVVDKEQGKAVAVKLENGKEIHVKKVVASSTDPSTLVLKHLGEDYVEKRVIGRVKAMEWGDAIMAIYLALDEPVHYYAGNKVTKSAQIHLSDPSLDYLSKIYYECRSGKIPSEPLLIMSNDSVCDPTRVPAGKHLIKFLVLNVPYEIKYDIKNTTGELKSTNRSDNRSDWNEIKEDYGDLIIDLITEKYMPELKKVILKKVILSPTDFELRPTTSIRGTLSCGAVLPYQISSSRPIPELAGYKIPSIPNVYLCGSGNHPGPGVSMAPGRNAAQVILADLEIDFDFP
ncbi:MAG TPA: NAD(P)/FAD-dependent oxidoreductase [Nitrososphaeraceae archaeon]